VKIVVLANPTEQEPLHGQERYLIDCGLALHAGWNEAKLRSAFGIPDPYRVEALVAAGYPCAVEDLPQEMQQTESRPRVRKAREEIVWLNPGSEPGL
jgi:hypothetical protein